MRPVGVALAALVLLASVPAGAEDVSTDKVVSAIRNWTVIQRDSYKTYYISAENTADNSADRTFYTAEIFDEPYSDPEWGIPPSWGYMVTRAYNCGAQTMTVKGSATLYLAGIKSDSNALSPTKRSEIRADDGIKYFAFVCDR